MFLESRHNLRKRVGLTRGNPTSTLCILGVSQGTLKIETIPVSSLESEILEGEGKVWKGGIHCRRFVKRQMTGNRYV